MGWFVIGSVLITALLVLHMLATDRQRRVIDLETRLRDELPPPDAAPASRA